MGHNRRAGTIFDNTLVNYVQKEKRFSLFLKSKISPPIMTACELRVVVSVLPTKVSCNIMSESSNLNKEGKYLL